jgi:hypothetical protein
VWFVVKGGRRELRQLAQISEIRVKMFLSVLDGDTPSLSQKKSA